MRIGTTVALVALIAVAGCGKKPAPEILPPVADNGGGGAGSSGGFGTTPGAPIPGSQADFVANIQSDTVYFDVDQFNIDESDRAILQSQAQWLARYPNVRVTIEGHCDERGTRDYNLALGERRANAAKSYLASLGVDAARIATVSYGKERPVALGSDEDSWAKNRRAVTITID